MSNEQFQNKYRIQTARAVWHDYNGGAYFITICTKNREHYFGEINNGIMQLSEIGKFASGNLQNITGNCPYAEIPLFVIMPNHVHAIVIIEGTHCRGDVASNVSSVYGKDVACNVSTTSNESRNGDVAGNVSTTNESRNEKMVEIAKCQSLLCVTIRGFKSAVTKFAHDNNIDFAWQTRFHDVIPQSEQNELFCRLY